MNAVLSTHGLVARYGDFQALYGVDIAVNEGEAVALIGANGAGKSTFLRAVMGLLPVAAEMVRMNGQPIGGTPTDRMVQKGVAIVPEGRRLFTGMSVDDNLRVAVDQAERLGRKGGWTLARLHQLFPILQEKARTPVQNLSGGQQQMVAIGRALMSRPEMILLDEPSMGLAPQLVEQIFEIVKAVNEGEGVTFLLAEQNTNVALRYAHYGYILESGRIVMDGAARALRENPDVKEFYLGMSEEGRKSFRDVRSYRRRKRWLA